MKKKHAEKLFLSLVSELDILLQNGFDIFTSLALFQRSLSNKEQSSALSKITNKIQNGTGITESLFSDVFSDLPLFYKTVFSSAEKSGTFPQALNQLKVFITRKDSFEKHMKRILIYPAVTLSVALIALFVTLFHFLPSLSLIYKDMEADLPPYAKLALSFSEKASSFSLLLLALVVTVSIVVFAAARKRRLPVKLGPFSPIIQWFQCYFLSFHLYMLLNTGMDFIKALEILAQHDAYNQRIREVLASIRSGESARESFEKVFSLPSSFLESLELGLKSGRLKNTFNYLFESSQARLESNMSLAASILEPALILLTASIVGIVVFLGLYPLLTLSNIGM